MDGLILKRGQHFDRCWGNVDSHGTKLYSGVVVVKFEIKVDFGKMSAIIYEDLKSLVKI